MSDTKKSKDSGRYVVLELVRTGRTVVRVDADQWAKAKNAGAVDLFLCAEMAAVGTEVTIMEPDGTCLDSSGRPATQTGGGKGGTP